MTKLKLQKHKMKLKTSAPPRKKATRHAVEPEIDEEALVECSQTLAAEEPNDDEEDEEKAGGEDDALPPWWAVLED